MIFTDILNVALGLAAFAIGVVLWATLSTMRPWRQALETAAPKRITGPLSCVALELGLLPWVLCSGGLGRLLTLFHNPLVNAASTGLILTITTLTLWHMYRAYRCVRRAVRKGSGE